MLRLEWNEDWRGQCSFQSVTACTLGLVKVQYNLWQTAIQCTLKLGLDVFSSLVKRVTRLNSDQQRGKKRDVALEKVFNYAHVCVVTHFNSLYRCVLLFSLTNSLPMRCRWIPPSLWHTTGESSRFVLFKTRGAFDLWPIKTCAKASLWCFCNGACRLAACQRGRGHHGA